MIMTRYTMQQVIGYRLEVRAASNKLLTINYYLSPIATEGSVS